MNPDEAAAYDEVLRFADALRPVAGPLPLGLRYGPRVCGRLEARSGDRWRLYTNPAHTCKKPAGLFMAAAAAGLDYYHSGADEAWQPLDDGSGHFTLFSDNPKDAASDPRAIIPLSEMPPVD